MQESQHEGAGCALPDKSSIKLIDLGHSIKMSVMPCQACRCLLTNALCTPVLPSAGMQEVMHASISARAALSHAIAVTWSL
jgi:hypothetical protein